MSRIHEALKKAEQERAAAQGTGLDSAAVGAGPATHFGAVSVEAAEMPAAAPGFSQQLTPDALLTRSQSANWHPDPETMLFFSAQDNAPGMEEFRTLRSRLYQLREKMPLKKLLVSSALPREGKSFVAANLAQVLAKQHGRRVLLIDGDLRGPKLHLVLGTSEGPGLSDYLMGEVDEFTAMQRGSMDNLFFLPAGKRVSSPAELVANGRLKFFMNRVDALFDWIVVDSPPAVAVSDPSLLANFCDGVLLVVRSTMTPFDAARKARTEFGDKQLLGVVLNGVQANDSAYSQHYYSYGQEESRDVNR
jgi:capsular exopolysaccharide synthesis family protein